MFKVDGVKTRYTYTVRQSPNQAKQHKHQLTHFPVTFTAGENAQNAFSKSQVHDIIPLTILTAAHKSS